MIALDWDHTLTAMSPALRTDLLAVLQQHDIAVIIVTNRGPNWPLEQPPPGIPVVYANGAPKRRAAQAAGYNVRWWLDDLPILVDLGAAGLSLME